MKKKIGMLTFHQCHNFGAMLCAYGLQQKVNSLGFDSEFIDLENEIFEQHGKKAGHQLYVRNDEQALKYVLKYEEDLKKRWHLFEKFKDEYLLLSDKVKNSEEIERIIDKYDILLIGGDQLWNEELPVSLDVFVLPFETKCKKVSYGTSMGDSKEISLRKRMYMKRFSVIGVRETYAAEYIKKYAEVMTEVTVDPVFLVSRGQWEKLAILPKEDSYIFAYIFNKGNENFEKCIKQLKNIARVYDKKIIVCASDGFEESAYLSAKIGIGPQEWLGYMLKAELIITNSFHGVAFSIIFEKEFVCLDTDCRKEELLNVCGMANRLEFDLKCFEDIKDTTIFYPEINVKLKDKIELSAKFLEQELK